MEDLALLFRFLLLKQKKINIKIPKSTEPKKLTREECVDLWNNQSEKKSGFKRNNERNFFPVLIQ